MTRIAHLLRITLCATLLLASRAQPSSAQPSGPSAPCGDVIGDAIVAARGLSESAADERMFEILFVAASVCSYLAEHGDPADLPGMAASVQACASILMPAGPTPAQVNATLFGCAQAVALGTLNEGILAGCLRELQRAGIGDESAEFLDLLAFCYQGLLAREEQPSDPNASIVPQPGPQPICPTSWQPEGLAEVRFVAAQASAQTPDCPPRRVTQQVADALAAAVRARITQMPFYGQSAQARANETISNPLVYGYSIAERENPQGVVGAVPITFPLRPGEGFLISWQAGWQVGPAYNATFRTPAERQAAFASRQNPCGNRTIVAAPFGAASCAGSSGSGGRPYTGSATTIIVGTCADVQTQVTIGIYTPPSHGAEDKTDVINTVRDSAQKWALEIAGIVNGAMEATCPQ